MSGYYLILRGDNPQRPGADPAEVARILGMSLYEARMALPGDVPRVGGRFDDRTLLQDRLADLRAIGLTGFGVAHEDLIESSPPMQATRARVSPSGIEWQGEDGPTQTIGADLRALVVGRYTHRAETSRPGKDRGGGAVLGGLTGGARARKLKTSTRETSERSMLLYTSVGDPLVEVREMEMDYTCLGKAMGPAAAINFNKLAEWAHALAAGAAFDNRLIKGFTPTRSPLFGHAPAVNRTRDEQTERLETSNAEIVRIYAKLVMYERMQPA